MSKVVPSYVTPDGTTVKLTATSSMPCRSWSLPAEKSCPASKASVRKLGDNAVCGSCYAMAGFYRMSNVKDAQGSRFSWVMNSLVKDNQGSRFRRFVQPCLRPCMGSNRRCIAGRAILDPYPFAFPSHVARIDPQACGTSERRRPSVGIGIRRTTAGSGRIGGRYYRYPFPAGTGRVARRSLVSEDRSTRWPEQLRRLPLML